VGRSGEEANRDSVDRVRVENTTEEKLYTNTWQSGCHRSDVAEVNGAKSTSVDVKNIACSGAETKHILTDDFKGEKPQVKQVEALAKEQKIKAVVISIGGNDLKLGDFIETCGNEWAKGWLGKYCYSSPKGKGLATEIVTLQKKITSVITNTRKVLDSNGSGSAEIIIQSYPNPLAPSKNARGGESWGWERLWKYGCPFWDKDLDFLREASGKLANSIHKVAKEQKVGYMNLNSLFTGHEACNDKAKQATETTKLSSDGHDAEWARYVIRSSVLMKQESLHPNYFGQKALQKCLKDFLAKSGGKDKPFEGNCWAAEGNTPGQAHLQPIGK
ncbi:GDSL-type esterase/lipase family protein, partial [Streptomyces sp. UNOC14_S4]|uniref:GDSL-type esterase/lipase family protein n=1 Tax=Streptomyces sp. UNOC14_S4 TaxID=2872340 RepID=UPI001E3E664F